jgi:flagellar biosynthesis/type III secretory pathway chaperone
MHMKLQSIEKKRIDTMRSLGLAGKTLVDVIEIAKGTAKEKLSEILEDLNVYIDELRQINDHNTKLVRARLEIIASVTKLFKEPRAAAAGVKGAGAGNEKIYGKNAKVLDQPGEFDSSVISKKI